MTLIQLHPRSQLRTLRSSHNQRHTTRVRAVVSPINAAVATQVDGYTVQGTSRKQNEDRFIIEPNSDLSVVAVFDGHGGNATAEWLASGNFMKNIQEYWQNGNAAEASITKAFLETDKKILAPKGGFLGMGERGIGGSKCGSTCAAALVYSDSAGKKLLTANVGDARVLLIRDGKAIQLTEDHVPDSEDERLRIERQNPNPKQPLVRYVGGTWRVGGLLALSRAFGDSYLKGTGQFEGIQAGGDGYSSGFGVIAEPYIEVTALTPEDSYIIVSSDGLNSNMERGGGGGLDNDEVAALVKKMSKKSCGEIAQALASGAVEAGSTDDVTVVVWKV